MIRDEPTSATDRVVAILEENLFLRPRIESSLERAGLRPCFVSGSEPLEVRPAAVLVNLDVRRASWEEFVGTLRRRFGVRLPIIGYGPHVDIGLFERARAAGCTEAVPNGLIARDAARVVQLHVDPRS